MTKLERAKDYADNRFLKDGKHRIVYMEPEDEKVLNDEGEEVKKDVFYIVQARYYPNKRPSFITEDAEEIYRTNG